MAEHTAPPLELLTLSGSLRAHSSHRNLLEALRLLAPPGVRVRSYGGLERLPAFNPDREDEPLPEVQNWRDHLSRSSALLISSPEYAHGMPGTLKNALDWVVGSGELVDRPVVLLSASPRAVHAQAQLTEVLRTMNAALWPELNLSLNLLSSGLDAPGIADHPGHALVLRTLLEALRARLQP